MFHFWAILYIFDFELKIAFMVTDHLTTTLKSVKMNSFAIKIGNAMLVFIYKTQEVIAIAVITVLSFSASREIK